VHSNYPTEPLLTASALDGTALSISDPADPTATAATPGATRLRANAIGLPQVLFQWMRQDSESVVVESQSVGYPSLFIEVR